MSFRLIPMCTYFGSLVLDSVSGTRKKKIALKDVQRIRSYSHFLWAVQRRKFSNLWTVGLHLNPFVQSAVWGFNSKYGSRGINLLYLVGKGNFTPLLGCDTCLDIEVLEFTNHKLIDTPKSEIKNHLCKKRQAFFFQTDFVLRDYEYCFSNKYIWKLIAWNI